MAFPSSPGQGAAAAGGNDPESFTSPCLAAVGDRLRRAREAQGLASSVLADRLHIGVEQLQALEVADRQRLPEPVFVIAQTRRIASALQVDITAELKALQASGELQPWPQPSGLRSSPAFRDDPAAVMPGRSPRWSSAGTWILGAGAALLLTLLAVGGGWRLLAPGSVPQAVPGSSSADRSGS